MNYFSKGFAAKIYSTILILFTIIQLLLIRSTKSRANDLASYSIEEAQLKIFRHSIIILALLVSFAVTMFGVAINSRLPSSNQDKYPKMEATLAIFVVIGWIGAVIFYNLSFEPFATNIGDLNKIINVVVSSTLLLFASILLISYTIIRSGSLINTS